MRTFEDFPDIAIPEFLQGAGWEDHSWHNDAAPHMQYPLPSGAGIVVWVAHDDPSMREDPSWNKFLVEYQPNIEEWVEEGRVILYDGNSEEEAKAIDVSKYV